MLSVDLQNVQKPRFDLVTGRLDKPLPRQLLDLIITTKLIFHHITVPVFKYSIRVSGLLKTSTQ